MDAMSCKIYKRLLDPTTRVATFSSFHQELHGQLSERGSVELLGRITDRWSGCVKDVRMDAGRPVAIYCDGLYTVWWPCQSSCRLRKVEKWETRELSFRAQIGSSVARYKDEEMSLMEALVDPHVKMSTKEISTCFCSHAVTDATRKRARRKGRMPNGHYHGGRRCYSILDIRRNLDISSARLFDNWHLTRELHVSRVRYSQSRRWNT